MVAVVLVGHGSRLPYNREVLEKLAEYVEEMGDFEAVEVGFMEFSEPSIPEAVKRAAESGADRIVVVPVFLAHGVHTKRDIPRMLGLEPDWEGEDHGHDHGHHHHHHDHREHEPVDVDAEIIYTEPIGADRRIAEIILDRIKEALEE
ncbi:MAG: sirohydrochlorin nickelochelatase [Euryarchaeota archaeon]